MLGPFVDRDGTAHRQAEHAQTMRGAEDGHVDAGMGSTAAIRACQLDEAAGRHRLRRHGRSLAPESTLGRLIGQPDMGEIAHVAPVGLPLYHDGAKDVGDPHQLIYHGSKAGNRVGARQDNLVQPHQAEQFGAAAVRAALVESRQVCARRWAAAAIRATSAAPSP